MFGNRFATLLSALAVAALTLSGCSGGSAGSQLPPAQFVAMQEGPGEEYVIGPLDELTIHVWRNPELGASVQVRPDGRITTPLVTDMPAVGKTPSMLAQDIRLQLSQYINEPLAELKQIVDLWADAALQLSEQDLKVMNRLTRAQSKLASAA